MNDKLSSLIKSLEQKINAKCLEVALQSLDIEQMKKELMLIKREFNYINLSTKKEKKNETTKLQ